MWQTRLEQVRALQQDPARRPAQEPAPHRTMWPRHWPKQHWPTRSKRQEYLAAASGIWKPPSVTTCGATPQQAERGSGCWHLFVRMGWGYDLLYHDLSEAERARTGEKLPTGAVCLTTTNRSQGAAIRTARTTSLFRCRAGRGGLRAVDEVADAAEWARLARAIYERVLATYSQDGYYTRALNTGFLDAGLVITWKRTRTQRVRICFSAGFKQMHLYVAHSLLPGGKYVFDLATSTRGRLRARGKAMNTSVPIRAGAFIRTTTCFTGWPRASAAPKRRVLPAWLCEPKSLQRRRVLVAVLVRRDADSQPSAQQPRGITSRITRLFSGRSDWTDKATAFAFKCGPPEGSFTPAAQLKAFPIGIFLPGTRTRTRTASLSCARAISDGRHRLRGVR